MMTDFAHRCLRGNNTTKSCALVDPSSSFLASSENHASKVPPFREPPCGIGTNTRKAIAVQCSLTSANQA